MTAIVFGGMGWPTVRKLFSGDWSSILSLNAGYFALACLGFVSATINFIWSLREDDTQYHPGQTWIEYRENRPKFTYIRIIFQRLTVAALLVFLAILVLRLTRFGGEIAVWLILIAVGGVLFPFLGRVSGTKRPPVVNPALCPIWDAVPGLTSSDLVALVASFPTPNFQPLTDTDGVLGVTAQEVILLQRSGGRWEAHRFDLNQLTAVAMAPIPGQLVFDAVGFHFVLYFAGAGRLRLKLFKQMGFYHPLFEALLSRIDAIAPPPGGPAEDIEIPKTEWAFTSSYRQF